MSGKHYRASPDSHKGQEEGIGTNTEELTKHISDLIRAAQKSVGHSPELMLAVMSSIKKLQSLPVSVQSTIREHLLMIISSARSPSEISGLAAAQATENPQLASNDERFELAA